MTFQRITLALIESPIAGLAGSFYWNWKTAGQVRTLKAFMEGMVFADVVSACEQAEEFDAVQVERRQAALAYRPAFDPTQQVHGHRQLHAGPPTACSAITIRSARRPTSDRVSWSGE